MKAGCFEDKDIELIRAIQYNFNEEILSKRDRYTEWKYRM